jgi:FkbM family methyltransferase
MSLLEKIQQKISYHIDPILTYTQNQRSPQSTYAQLQEDIVIQALIGTVDKFIDVGAYDGIKYSNTFLFALQGAKGLCFEPVKSTFFKLERLYLFNPRVECINEGISNAEKTLEIKSYGPLSSIDETKNPRHRELVKFDENAPSQTITVRPLNSWLSKYSDLWHPDVISIDVEGHELQVLKGIDFSRLTTKCWVIETHHSLSELWIHQDYDEINQTLESFGYQAVLKNKYNTFWLKKELVNPDKIQNIVEQFAGYVKITIT